MDENGGLLKRILQSFEHQEGLDDLLAMSEHPSGYKRENAVRRLGMLGNPVAIPKLLVRANDWVPQVRSAASEALVRLLTSKNAQAFIYSLPALYHLQQCGRADHSELIAAVNRFLLETSNVAYIRAAIRKEDPYIARIAARLCIENSLDNRETIVSECLAHGDVIVRSLASSLLRDLTGEALERMLKVAIGDPFMPVRREAFQLYVRTIPETSKKVAHRMLFDRHIAIREMAIAQLVKNGTDVEKIFAEILSSSNRSPLKLRCAILGVSTLRAKSLTPLVQNFINHRLPSLRKASLQAIAKLNDDEARAYLLAGMRDESPSVAKESMNLLGKAAQKPTPSELTDIVKEGTADHTLDVCLRCARMLNKWDRLIFILEQTPLASDAGTTSEQLDRELRRWDFEFNRSSSQPTNGQKQRITELYKRQSQAISERNRRALVFTIKTFGITV